MIKVVFFGSDQYSQIVLDELQKDRNLRIVSLKDHPNVGVIASYGEIIPQQIIEVKLHVRVSLSPIFDSHDQTTIHGIIDSVAST